MKKEQYRKVHTEIMTYLIRNKPIAAAHVFEQWAGHFNSKQYYELADLIHNSLEKGEKQ